MPQTLSVTEHFQLGRFGQVLLSSGRPARAADQRRRARRAGAAALQAANDLQPDHPRRRHAGPERRPDRLRAAADSRSAAANTLRGGDTATGLVGVLNYTWGGNAASANAYRLRPVGALGGHVSTSSRPTRGRPTRPPSAATLRVVGHEPAQLLQHPRHDRAARGGVTGAVDGLPRRRHQPPSSTASGRKTVAAVTGTSADVVGIMEMENDGYGPTAPIAVPRRQAQRRRPRRAPTRSSTPTPRTGQTNALGTDAIKVGLLYKPAARHAGRHDRRAQLGRLRQRRRRRVRATARRSPRRSGTTRTAARSSSTPTT